MRMLRRLHADQRGLSFAELITSLAMLLLVSGAFITVTQTVQMGVERQGDHSRANDQARLAIEQIDREVRSGSILYNPGLESPAFYGLRVYTQSNATTRPSGSMCVQWRIYERELQRRDWAPGAPGTVTGWQTIATNIVNIDLLKRAFELDPDPVKSGRTLDVTLFVDGDIQDPTVSPVRIQTSITGRNAALGNPESVCAAGP